MINKLLARFYYMWGSLHRNFGNRTSFTREHASAVQRFTQAYQMDPTMRKALLDRGILYHREMGMPDEALKDFNNLIEDDPEFAPALLNRAMVFQELGRYSEALQDIRAYLALPEENEDYYLIATRTAALLQDIVDEMEGKAAAL